MVGKHENLSLPSGHKKSGGFHGCEEEKSENSSY